MVRVKSPLGATTSPCPTLSAHAKPTYLPKGIEVIPPKNAESFMPPVDCLFGKSVSDKMEEVG